MAPWNTSLLHFLLSQLRDFTSLFLFLFLPRLLYEVKRWKRNSSMPGNFGQRTYSVKSLSITVIPSYLGKTKTVVRETVIVLCCQLCYLKYSGMTTAAAVPSLFYLAAVIVCLSIHTETTWCVWHKENERPAWLQEDGNLSMKWARYIFYVFKNIAWNNQK